MTLLHRPHNTPNRCTGHSILPRTANLSAVATAASSALATANSSALAMASSSAPVSGQFSRPHVKPSFRALLVPCQPA
eukprot:364210-Chlamydomonas_euryale.AAC.5